MTINKQELQIQNNFKEKLASTYFSLKESFSLIKTYFYELYQILFHPVFFFEKIAPSKITSHALNFALITHWIGSAFVYLWKLIFTNTSLTLPNFLNLNSSFLLYKLKKAIFFNETIHSHFSRWMINIAQVLLDPFFVFFSILVKGFFLFIGAKFFIPLLNSQSTEFLSYPSAIRILSYSTAAYILQIIPYLGNFLSHLLAFLITTLAIKKIHHITWKNITWKKAIIITLFPKLILLILILLSVIILVLFFFYLFAIFI